MDYVALVLRTAPVMYVPLDDVVPSGGARQLGSSAATVGYTAAAVRSHHKIIDASDTAGADRDGSLRGSSGVNAQLLGSTGFTGPAAGQPYSWAFWGMAREKGIGTTGQLYIGSAPIAHPHAGELTYAFFPFVDNLCYVYAGLGSAPVAAKAMGNYFGWTHWAMVGTATGAWVYRDGVRWGGLDYAHTIPAVTAQLYIAGTQDYRHQHLAFWNRALSAAEIRLLARSHGL